MEALIPAGKVQSSYVPRYKIIMSPKLLSTGGSEREIEGDKSDREHWCQIDSSSESLKMSASRLLF